MELINPNKVILPGADDHLVDTESIGETKMSVIIRSKEEQLIVWLRDRLKQGCVIEATNVNAPVLEKDDSGDYLTGLSFYWPRGTKPGSIKDGPSIIK